MRYTVEDICRMSEGQTFDCKSIKIDPKALATTIVAMANADGGMIAVGITDKSRRIEGVDQEQEHLNEILRTPFDFCVPTVSVTTEFLPCKDSEDTTIIYCFSMSRPVPAFILLFGKRPQDFFLVPESASSDTTVLKKRLAVK